MEATATNTKESTMFNLVAYDFGRNAGFDVLVNRIGAIAEIVNVVECETTSVTGEAISGRVITISGVRNTVAHDLSCRLGFIGHCEVAA